MTLYEMVAGGGVLLSIGVLAVLEALGPVRRGRCVLSMRSLPPEGSRALRVVAPRRRGALRWRRVGT